jgi:hypothetical protein
MKHGRGKPGHFVPPRIAAESRSYDMPANETPISRALAAIRSTEADKGETRFKRAIRQVEKSLRKYNLVVMVDPEGNYSVGPGEGDGV